MRWRGTAYRAHDPRWAFSPTSGAGAAIRGGRFNRIGQPALYLALSIDGMFLEMGHGFARRLSPLTVVSYDVDVDGIADLTTEESRAAAETTIEELGCAWASDLALSKEPPSWRLTDRLMSASAAGVLVPSFARGADPERHINLVLWTWGSQAPRKVEVFDPDGRLLRSPAPFRAPALRTLRRSRPLASTAWAQASTDSLAGTPPPAPRSARIKGGSGMSDERSGRGEEPTNPGDEAAPGAPGTGENVCPDCAGTGRKDEAACPTCSGTGKVIEGIGGG